jgi:hypothetical protein
MKMAWRVRQHLRSTKRGRILLVELTFVSLQRIMPVEVEIIVG